jgi:hypothetical protein
MHAVLPSARPASLPSFSFSFRPSRGLFASALALVLVIATGSEAAFASEKTLPGDILYPVKVAVAEPIALALAPSAEVKAELSTRFASRRIVEAATLSERGKLTDERAEELATRFEAHIDTADKEAQVLEAKGDIDTSLAIRANLEQGINEQVVTLAPVAPAAIMALSTDVEPAMMKAKVAEVRIGEDAASEQKETPASHFLSRVGARARAFADARIELENALAVHVDPSTDVGAGVAVVDAANLLPNENDDDPASVRVLSAAATSDLAIAASATTTILTAATLATSTPTTTPETAPAAKTESSASRFFAPFFIRDKAE